METAPPARTLAEQAGGLEIESPEPMEKARHGSATPVTQHWRGGDRDQRIARACWLPALAPGSVKDPVPIHHIHTYIHCTCIHHIHAPHTGTIHTTHTFQIHQRSNSTGQTDSLKTGNTGRQTQRITAE